METKNKGSLMIKMNRNGDKTIMFNPVNGTVWLTKSELIQLFDVYQQTINACIDMILKVGVFNIEDVCKYNLIANTTTNTKYTSSILNLLYLWLFVFVRKMLKY